MQYEVEILEATGSYSNIKIKITGLIPDVDADGKEVTVELQSTQMAKQIWIAQKALRDEFGGVAKTEQKDKVKDEIVARKEAVEETTDVGAKCGHCGDWAPQLVSKAGLRYFKCNSCHYVGFNSKFNAGEINWKEPKEK